MSIGPEYWYLLLAPAAGGVFVVAITSAAARFGTVGGVLGGLPLTGAWAIAAIGLTQGIGSAMGAVGGYLLGCGVWVAFHLAYAYLGKGGFRFAIASSLAVWGIMASLAALSGNPGFEISLVSGLAISASVLFVYFGILRFKSYGGEDLRPRLGESGVKFATSFGILLGALLASRFAGPFLGGLIPAAPVISSQILFWTYRSKGLEFSRSLTQNMALTGTLSIFPYGTAVWLTYPLLGGALGPSYGVICGSVIAYGVATAGAYLSYRIARRATARQALDSTRSSAAL